MKNRYRLYRRRMGGVFYVHDSETGKQESLGTRDRAEATTLLNARNESVRQPQLNLHIAKAYLAGTDSGVSTRTWQNALDAIVESKIGSTKDRWRRAAKETALDLIRGRVIIETQAEQLLACLKAGTVSTNVHLRKLHNFCLAMIHFGDEIEMVLRRLPSVGPLFPYLRSVRCGDRATEFKQRCEGLGINGVSLHSYRYAWAERAKQCGYPERFAQEALGHNSKAVHRAYARKAKVKLPSLESYERQATDGRIIQLPSSSAENPPGHFGQSVG
jgi:hypothetical protein